jgi:antitoxin MazE
MLVSKWGNSLGIRIPKSIAEQVALQEGDEISLLVEGNKIIISPAKKSKYTLEELLEGMSDENLHSEIDWGTPQGNETW